MEHMGWHECTAQQLVEKHCIAGDVELWRPAEGVLLHKIYHCCMECGCIDRNRGYVVNLSKPLSRFLHSSCNVTAAAKALNQGCGRAYLLLVPASL